MLITSLQKKNNLDYNFLLAGLNWVIYIYFVKKFVFVGTCIFLLHIFFRRINFWIKTREILNELVFHHDPNRYFLVC